MRRAGMFFFYSAAILVWAFAVHAAEDVEGKIFYTATNIWYDNQNVIESTNYIKGVFLPIGTKVKITGISDGSIPVISNMNTEDRQAYIRFTDLSGKPYRIVFVSRHAKSGTGVWDLFKHYFSQNDPTAPGTAFSSLTNEDQKRVREGEVSYGMSKSAVIMTLGYPPSHRTESLQLNKWIYWENYFRTRAIYFQDDKVVDDTKKKKASSRVSSIEECIKACREYTTRTSEQCFDECKPK